MNQPCDSNIELCGSTPCAHQYYLYSVPYMKAAFLVLAALALAVEGSFDQAAAAYKQTHQANYCFYFSGDGDPTAGGKFRH